MLQKSNDIQDVFLSNHLKKKNLNQNSLEKLFNCKQKLREEFLLPVKVAG